MTVPAAKLDAFTRPAHTGPKHKNQIEYEKKMSELDGRISYLKARLDELKGGYSQADGESGSARGKMISELKGLREQCRPLQEERRAWAKEAAELRETVKRRGGELKEAKDKLAFKSVPEIEARIAEYETQLETGNFRLSEEKQIVTEISKLNKAKKALLVLEGPGSKATDLGSLKLRIDALQEKIKARDAELDGSRAQMDALNAKLDALNGTRATERVSKEERQAQFTKLRAELDEAYEARRKAYEENKVQRAAAFEARQKRHAREKEEERRAEILERIADLEERLAAHNPESLLDKKLAECGNMISFFKGLVGADQKGAVTAQEPSKLAAPVGRTVTVSEEMAAFEVVKKDEDDVLFLGGAGKNKKKGPKAASSTTATAAAAPQGLGKLPIHVLAGLTDLHLAIPSTLDQVPILLEALDKVKTAIAQKKTEMEASGAVEAQAVDPKMQALTEQLDALKIELEKKPEEPVAAEATA